MSRSRSRSEPGAFGSLEPEPLEEKKQEPEPPEKKGQKPESPKNLAGSSALLEDKTHK